MCSRCYVGDHHIVSQHELKIFLPIQEHIDAKLPLVAVFHLIKNLCNKAPGGGHRDEWRAGNPQRNLPFPVASLQLC